MTKEQKRDAGVGGKIEKANAEVAAGRSWRAKEILRGCVGAVDYASNPELLKAYGELLDRLGDRYDAGKYLFLSGSTRSEHQEAIEIYLSRNQRVTGNDFASQFPAALRHQGLGNLPDNVKSKLADKGINEFELTRTGPREAPVAKGSWKGTAVVLGCIALLGSSLLFWIVGVVSSIRWIMAYF